MTYVFRNNTIERFFGKDFSFSGYDDISVIPAEADSYVWWYQVPIKYDQRVLAEEINGYVQKLHWVLGHMDSNKSLVAFTMEILYHVPLTENDCQVKLAVADYNAALYQIESQYSHVKVIDLGEFTRQYPAHELMDWKFYFMYQMGMNPQLAKPFKAWFERKLESIALKRKKCLVLDLDHTLWGGVLGEDGVDGIQIGGDYPGKAFLYWQEALCQLAKNGVILAVCSKNNEEDVLEAWEKHPSIVLKKEALSAYRINWRDKATNIKELADELNIGLDSMVFVDDNPTEREWVKQMLPMVSVPDFPEQPYLLPVFFQQLVHDYFKVYSVTEEDRNKTEQYQANANRVQAQEGFADYDAFLKSLDIRITIEAANEYHIPRISQMTQKTNQFNLTTRRYMDTEIRGLMEQGWKIWCTSVADKFGDDGITGCIMINGDQIDTFLLSCRILGKGIEFVFLKKVLEILFAQGFTSLKARYIPTLKNAQVSEFYEKCHFTCTRQQEDGSKEYEIDLAAVDYQIKDSYQITIK